MANIAFLSAVQSIALLGVDPLVDQGEPLETAADELLVLSGVRERFASTFVQPFDSSRVTTGDVVSDLVHSGHERDWTPNSRILSCYGQICI